MPYGWYRYCFLLLVVAWVACHKSSDAPPEPPPPTPQAFTVTDWLVDQVQGKTHSENIAVRPAIRLKMSARIDRSSVAGGVSLAEGSGNPLGFVADYENTDSTLVIRPAAPLNYLARYKVLALTGLKSTAGTALKNTQEITFHTRIDSSRKFPLISEDSLLTLVQRQTFRYFWEFGHPVSGMARERNTSGDVVTSGGTGFGVMAMVAAIHRGFISRDEGLQRVQTIVSFLTQKAQKYHGTFPHWLHGVSGQTVAFSQKDNGADLVETSFLMMGLLTARQYFDGAGAGETTLRQQINDLWQAVEWSWFRKNNEQVLYWHWSPTYQWDMNMPIRGWNEGLIVYVLAASSPHFTIPATVYTQGWAGLGASGFTNGNTYFGLTLPLGPAYGGPLFFSHYSFLGLKPTGLQDAYAQYQTQNVNHSLINYQYCRTNPNGYFGYSDSVWGLTASDIPGGYAASSPTHDLGVIAPTAALSAFPYSPEASMKALKFYYYVLGDKLWGQYGFRDAFSLKELWFADSYLAIDQGPIMVMIENYRSGLLWKLFMGIPEIKQGLKKLDIVSNP